MRSAFTMRFQPEVTEFVQRQASAQNRTVNNFVETLLLREKEQVEEAERQLSVWADPKLMLQDRHELVRDHDESDDEYARRGHLFEALLARARTK